MRLTQVVPERTGGVGDLAEALAGALARHGIESRFVIGGPLDTEDAAVLLHYVGYGYDTRGCPTRLVEACERWRRHGDDRDGRDGRRLVTLFHEVYATGPPWRSSFWLSPVQRRLAARLARASDAVTTSVELYAGLLGRWVPRQRIAVLPVPSTVGEPAAVPALADRRRRLVVFGGGARARAWGEHRASMEAAIRALAIEEVHDVGPPGPRPPASLAEVAGVPVVVHGPLAAVAVSALLLDAAAGFLAYPPALLGKSTVFAAYCAHGLLPVCAWRDGRLAAGEAPFWAAGSATPDDGGLQAIATAARAWYSGHALACQADLYQRLFQGAEG